MYTLQASIETLGALRAKCAIRQGGSKYKTAICASQDSNFPVDRHNATIQKIKKKWRVDREALKRKRVKTPRGPCVFTRGFLNGCREIELHLTVEELKLDEHIRELDFEVSM